MVTDLKDQFVGLFFTRDQFLEILLRIVPERPPGTETTQVRKKFTWASAPAYSLVFHLSTRFSAESSLIRYRASIGFDDVAPGVAEPVVTREDLKPFEFQGSTRFHLMTGAFKPYVKYGLGSVIRPDSSRW